MKRNYQRELDERLARISQEEYKPLLVLHSCCAPCSSYPLEYLSSYFRIIIVYYNPNISSLEEYDLRLCEQKRLVSEMGLTESVEVVDGGYNVSDFYDIAKGYEKCPERGERCHRCYELRLRFAAEFAKQTKADYFATTLTLSPLKDAEVLNDTGFRLADEYGVEYLATDFKKKNGYKRSIELSAKYGLYRQNFCGCIFSKREAEKRDAENNKN